MVWYENGFLSGCTAGNLPGSAGLCVSLVDCIVSVLVEREQKPNMKTRKTAERASRACSDATLKALTTDVGTIWPSLYHTRSSFVVNVAHGVTAASIAAIPAGRGAKATLHGKLLEGGRKCGPCPLTVGCNRFPVLVTAADGMTRRTYEVKIIRSAATPRWTRVLEHAPFKIRDSEGELVFKNRMWILGGYTPKLVTDVWSSTNGLQWKRAGKIPDQSGINIPVQFAHAGRMWISGNTGKFFSSRDGAKWSLVTEKAPWAGRYAAGSAVFKGRMWVAGGLKDHTAYNDVWSSADGRRWNLETAHAEWSPRQVFGNLVVHDDKLWLVGGGIASYQPFRAYTDVWSSRDGRSWELVTAKAPWPCRIWSSCAVFRGHLWLLGGYRAQPDSRNLGDVWYSRDGQEWEELVSENVWSARHELSPMVLDDKLWVVAGNAWPLMNDIWQLDIPGLTFVSQPVVEEYRHALYRYEAMARFNRSGKAVRYRLVQAPDWLEVDAARGVISGTLPAVGEFPVTIEAFDADSESTKQMYVLHVIPIG